MRSVRIGRTDSTFQRVCRLLAIQLRLTGGYVRCATPNRKFPAYRSSSRRLASKALHVCQALHNRGGAFSHRRKEQFSIDYPQASGDEVWGKILSEGSERFRRDRDFASQELDLIACEPCEGSVATAWGCRVGAGPTCAEAEIFLGSGTSSGQRIVSSPTSEFAKR
jgi:hypothetical protein